MLAVAVDEDPLVAHRRRQAEKKDLERRLAEMKAAGPIVIVPSPMDVALGYRFIVPSDSTLPKNAKSARNRLRAAGWWAYANMVVTVMPGSPATEKAPERPSRLKYSYGVHAFTSYPPADGDIGLVAYWCGRDGFAWAQRADYGQRGYSRTLLSYAQFVEVMKEGTR